MANKWKKYPKGGEILGNTHEEGGVPLIAEGDEIIINANENNAARIHQDELLALNENPEDYQIIHKGELASHGGLVDKNSVNRGSIEILEYINKHGDIPMSDARDRSKK
jgi:hypothetical protein